MRKILVAIDGSEGARRALDFAVRQATYAPPAQLHVLTVRPPASTYTAWEIYVTAERIQEAGVARARDVLDAAAKQLEGSGCSYSLELLEGEPAETIARRATDLG